MCIYVYRMYILNFVACVLNNFAIVSSLWSLKKKKNHCMLITFLGVDAYFAAVKAPFTYIVRFNCPRNLAKLSEGTDI